MEILVCLQVRKSLRPKGFGLLARLERMEGGIMTLGLSRSAANRSRRVKQFVL